MISILYLFICLLFETGFPITSWPGAEYVVEDILGFLFLLPLEFWDNECVPLMPDFFIFLFFKMGLTL